MEINQTQGTPDYAGQPAETVAPIEAAVEKLPDPSVGQEVAEPVGNAAPVTETPADAMPPEPVAGAIYVDSGVMVGNPIKASHFVPTHHFRIARHSGKFPEGSMGSLPLADRLQQAWVDHYNPSAAEWRDVPVVIFDDMPEAVSKVE